MTIEPQSNGFTSELPPLLTSRRGLLQRAGLVAVSGVALGALGNPLTVFADEDSNDHDLTILRFSSMAGIQAPFLGDAGLAQFRGLNGGTGPWVLRSARGSLSSGGTLSIRVRGLVLDPATVPAPMGGTNPVPSFMAIVSGFSKDPVNPVNVTTGLFPATNAGNSDIEEDVQLPHPFFAPIVFVTSLPIAVTPGGTPAPRWFAVTGLQ